jgi:hypothetical protein
MVYQLRSLGGSHLSKNRFAHSPLELHDMIQKARAKMALASNLTKACDGNPATLANESIAATPVLKSAKNASVGKPTKMRMAIEKPRIALISGPSAHMEFRCLQCLAQI